MNDKIASIIKIILLVLLMGFALATYVAWSIFPEMPQDEHINNISNKYDFNK